MERSATPALAIVFGILSSFLAQGQAYQRVGLPVTLAHGWSTLQRGGEGSLFRYTENDTLTWMSFDVAGNVLWSKRSPDVGHWKIIELNNGGILECTAGTFHQQNQNINDDDTVTFGILTNWFDAAGNPVQRMRHDRTIVSEDAWGVGVLEDVGVVEGGDGSLYFLIHHYSLSYHHLEVLKTDAQGTLQWARAIGTTAGNLPLGIPRLLTGSSIWDAFRMEPIDSSGVIIQYNMDDSDGHQLIRLSANGDLDWIYKYGSGIPQSWMRSQEMTLDQNGATLSHGILWTSSGERQLFIRTDPTGSVTEVDLAEYHEYAEHYDLTVSLNNSAVIMYNSGSIFPAVRTDLLICPQTGPTAMVQEQRIGADQFQNFWGRTSDIHLQNDTLMLLGNWNMEEQLTGITFRSPSITRHPLNAFPTCMWEDTLITRADLPVNSITVTDLSVDHIAMPIDQFYTATPEPAPIVFVPAPPPIMIDRCSFFTDVPEREARELMLFPSPVAGDGVLFLERAAGERYRILDMSGRQVATGRLAPSADRWSIPLPGLEPGMYLLDVFDPSGLRIGTGRFLVQ